MGDVIDAEVTERPSTELTKPMETDLSKLTPQQIDDRVKAIELAADAKKRMTMAACKLLYEKDWQDFGGKPYLTGAGAMRLCAVGIHLSAPVFEISEMGDDVFVNCTIEASWPAMGQRCEQVGTCNTRDKFWNSDSDGSFINQCRRNAENDERLARKMMVGHIRKKAQENATSRAVCSVMGIRGMTWEDLKAAGFTAGNAGVSVTYKKGATKDSRTAATSQSPSVPMADVIGQAVGSIVTTSGKISSVEEKKKRDGEAYFRIGFEAGPMANYWNANPEEWVRVGQDVIATIKVGKYGDGKSYQIEHLEMGEDNEPS